MQQVRSLPEWITLPGLSDYKTTLELMENKVAEVITKISQDTIYLVEHQDIYTAGTNFKDEELLDSGNIPVFYTGRGGKFTYHGKGQRVIYPILDLATDSRRRDLKLYIRFLEQWIINTLRHFGINAYVVQDRVGVWVKEGAAESKIAAIGIRVKKWVSYHGIAVNISPDLDKFKGIIACGLANFGVTSFCQLGIKIELEEFDQVLKREFNRVEL